MNSWNGQRGADTMAAKRCVDVLVVGSGLAAHRAALEASNLGADVLMIEKMAAIGGSSAMSGGSFAFAGTDAQRAAGIDDGPDRLRHDLEAVSEGECDPALLDLYIAHQLEEYAFLRNIGVEFGTIQLSSGQSAPRSHPAHPGKVLELLNNVLLSRKGVALRLKTKAMRIWRDVHSRRLDTVAIEGYEGEEIIQARRGIILATGGFSRSETLLKLFVPEIRKALRAGGRGNDGDGLIMAWEHGAAMADLGFVKSTFGSYIEVDELEPHTTLLPVYRGAIALNLDGHRFVNESGSYKTLGQAVLRERDGRAWQIFDTPIMKQTVPGVPSFDFESALRKDRIIEADSIEDLCSKADLNVDQVSRAITRYNSDVIGSGKDNEFGRTSLGYRYGKLVPIQQPPFYGYLCTASINSTYAGLRVDDSMAVLNVWGERLGPLYAAGELVGGFHGQAYMTGTSLVKAMVFGKVAARSAVLSSMEATG